MNTDKTLIKKFCIKEDYPTWYYKQLYEVDIDYVITHMLTDNISFVVDIKGDKYEIMFGKNRKNEIDKNIRYGDMIPKDRFRTSYKVINDAFKYGTWYIIDDKDTTEEYKSNYREQLKKFKDKKELECNKSILKNAVRSFSEDNKLSKEQIEYFYNEIDNMDLDGSREFIKILLSKFEKEKNYI